MTTEPTSGRVQPHEWARQQAVRSVIAYRGECWCGWFGALRGVPLASEMDIAEHVKEKHAVTAPASTSSGDSK